MEHARNDQETPPTAEPVGERAWTAPPIAVTWASTVSQERLGKIWKPEGKWPVTDGVKRRAFVFEPVGYPDFEAFGAALTKRMRAGCFALVAGCLKRPPRTLDRNRAYPRTGKNFADRQSWLLALDFDGLAPMKAEARLDRPEDFGDAAIAEVRQRLPAALAAGDCLMYATASTGMAVNSRGEPANGCARFRGVFWLSRPLLFAEQKQIVIALRERPGLDCLDLAIYSVPQFSFIARPEFPDGMADPIVKPVILCRGGQSQVDVDALLTEIDVEPAPKGRRGTRGPAAGMEERRLNVAPELRVPLVRQAVEAIVNNLDRIDWVHFAHAVDGAVDGDPAGREIFLAARDEREGKADPYEENVDWVGDADPGKGAKTDPREEAERVWDTRGEGRAGFGYLMQLLEKQGAPEAEAAIDAIRRAQAEAAFDEVTPEMLDEIEAASDPEWLQGLNARYAFIHDRPDAVFDLRGADMAIVTPLSIPEFNNRFANKFEAVGGKKRPSISKLWFVHPRRREYATAGDYPIGKEPKGALNLWTGLPIAPKPGAWPTIEEFLRRVICGSDAGHFDYLRNLLFWKLQRPTENPEVAISLQSKSGYGKGSFGRMLERLFGPKRFQQFLRADDATAKFNADAEGRMVLFYDEVFFGHDRRLLGRLKGEITEPRLPIEPKGVNRYYVRNIALRVYVSNEIAHIPIDLDDRRFFALEVSDVHAKDFAYFAKLTAAIEGDELAALVHDALSADLSGFESVRREPPKTKARARLAAATARPEEEYLVKLLERGEPLELGHRWRPQRYPRMEPEPREPWRNGQVTVDRDMLFDDYLAWMRSRQARRPSVNSAEFHGIVQDILGSSRFCSRQVKETGGGGKRRYVLLIASLDDCREAFDRHVGREQEWNDAASADDELEDEDPV